MKRNEKILASALGLVVVGYFGSSLVDSTFVAPVRELEADADLLQSDVANLGTQIVQLKVAERQLDTWSRQSLPGKPLDAERLYQQWLADLATACGLELDSKGFLSRTTPLPGSAHTTVSVELKGQGRFAEIQTFMRLLNDAELLHHISRVNIPKTPAASGDPELAFTISAEGLNAADAPDRRTLFPQYELRAALPATSESLGIPGKELAARVGDRVRFGKELAEVVEVSDQELKLKRGIDGTSAADHSVGVVAELLPLKREARTDSSPAFAGIQSPFVKPQRYEPAFDGFVDQKLERGKALRLSPKVADYDPSAGSPTLELVDAPDGLELDATSGELSWTPAADLPAGDYKVSLVANVASPQKRLEKTITVTLTDPNTPPTLEALSASEVFLGETLKLTAKANDAQDGMSLTFKVEQGPEGATIDSKGEFTWSVPPTFSPGEVSVTIAAADKGSPPLEAKQTFKVNVREDLRPFVYMTHTGSDTVQGKKTWKAWLTDRSSGRTMYLYEGKTFEAAGLTGEVKEIGDDFVKFERNDAIYRIGLGQNLKDATKLDSPVAEATDAEPTEAEKPETPKPATAAATEATPTR